MLKPCERQGEEYDQSSSTRRYNVQINVGHSHTYRIMNTYIKSRARKKRLRYLQNVLRQLIRNARGKFNEIPIEATSTYSLQQLPSASPRKSNPANQYLPNKKSNRLTCWRGSLASLVFKTASRNGHVSTSATLAVPLICSCKLAKRSRTVTQVDPSWGRTTISQGKLSFVIFITFVESVAR